MRGYVRNFGSQPEDYTRFAEELQAMDDVTLEEEYEVTASGDFPHAQELHEVVQKEVARRSQQ